MHATVRNPTDAQGELQLDAHNVSIGTLRFDTAGLRVTGTERNHSVQLRVAGPRMKSELTAQGSHERSAWTGSLATASLEVVGVAPLALQTPVRVDASSDDIRFSNICLIGAEIS